MFAPAGSRVGSVTGWQIWRLHFIGVGLGQFAIEIQIHEGLIDTIKILKVGERDQPIISEALGLIVS